MRCVSYLTLVGVLGGVLLSVPSVHAQLKLNPYPLAEPEKNFDWKDDSASRSNAPSVIPMPDEAILEEPVREAAPIVAKRVGEAWAVNKGQDLRSVLEGWSRTKNVDFIWDVRGVNYSVLRSFNINGSYEEAVKAVLDQYAGRGSRPLGQIYVANGERKKTLVITLQQ